MFFFCHFLPSRWIGGDHVLCGPHVAPHYLAVKSYGTEDRETQFPIAPQNQCYDYILFRGTDIKDIRVINNNPVPNDPAIMQMHLPPQQPPQMPMPNKLGQPSYQSPQGFMMPQMGGPPTGGPPGGPMGGGPPVTGGPMGGPPPPGHAPQMGGGGGGGGGQPYNAFGGMNNLGGMLSNDLNVVGNKLIVVGDGRSFVDGGGGGEDGAVDGNGSSPQQQQQQQQQPQQQQQQQPQQQQAMDMFPKAGSTAATDLPAGLLAGTPNARSMPKQSPSAFLPTIATSGSVAMVPGASPRSSNEHEQAVVSERGSAGAVPAVFGGVAAERSTKRNAQQQQQQRQQGGKNMMSISYTPSHVVV